MPSQLKDIAMSIYIPVMLILLYLLYANVEEDIKNSSILDSSICHKEVRTSPISQEDRLRLELLIDNYLQKKDMNDSRCYNIWNELKTGAVRGALGAVILGGGAGEALTGSIVYGTISGLAKAYSLQYTPKMHLNSKKPL